jgi:hypothetical protein
VRDVLRSLGQPKVEAKLETKAKKPAVLR